MNFKVETPNYNQVQKLVSKGYDLLLNEFPFFSLEKTIYQNVVVKIDIFPYKEDSSCLMMWLMDNKRIYKDIKEMEDVVNLYRDCLHDLLTTFQVLVRLY